MTYVLPKITEGAMWLKLGARPWDIPRLHEALVRRTEFEESWRRIQDTVASADIEVHRLSLSVDSREGE